MIGPFRRDAVLMQFARAPVRGRVKTRLAPALGDEGCLALHKALVSHTHRHLTDSGLASVELHVAGGDEDVFSDLIPKPAVKAQASGDLGARMNAAFVRAFAGGARHALLVGSDCPFIDQGVLTEALEALETGCDAVFGPAVDGGYYLVGLAGPRPELFCHMPWGTATVMDRTRRRLAALALPWHCLPALSDIDRPEDLAALATVPDLARFAKF